jgi:pantetheine-phosphate adenylyltransferase
MKLLQTIEIAILYHDVVYVVGSKTNEEESVARFKNDYINGKFKVEFDIDFVSSLIMATKNHSSENYCDQIIIEADLEGLLYGDFNRLISDEEKIFKEFQKYSVNNYRNGRVNFLHDFHIKTNVNNLIPDYIQYINNKIYSIGLYLGSFNPFHIGHKDILNQAEEVFDKVIICRGESQSKKGNKQYSSPELPNQIINYSNIFVLLDQIANDNKNCDLHIVRGMRNQYDIQGEEQFRKVIKSKVHNTKFVYFFCKSELDYISSSIVRELHYIGEDIGVYLV